jgi:hypothetical protein
VASNASEKSTATIFKTKVKMVAVFSSETVEINRQHDAIIMKKTTRDAEKRFQKK